MKPERRLSLLRIAAAAAVAAFIYTGAVTLRVILFKTDGGITAFLLFLFAVLSGYFAGRVFSGASPAISTAPICPDTGTNTYKSDRDPAGSDAPGISASGPKRGALEFISFMLNLKINSRLLSHMIAWLIMIVPLLASFLMSGRLGIFRASFEMAFIAVVYGISLKCSKYAYYHIMRKSAVYTGFIIFAACLEALYFFKAFAYLRPLFFAASCFFIFVYLILRNQEDIDENIFNNRHVEKFVLPGNLRRFNTLYACAMFLLILLLFNLEPVVSYVLKIAGKLIALIIEGVLWLMANLFPEQEPLQQGVGMTRPDMGLEDQAKEMNPIIEALLNIIILCIMLYVAYRALRYILRRLPGVFRGLVEWLKRLFSIHTGEAPFETEDYIDESETLKPARIPGRKPRIGNIVKKGARNPGGMSDPAAKVRYMYARILKFLSSKGVNTEKSDTTLEILNKKELPAEIKEELLPFTGVYNQVRYGGKVPDPRTLAGVEEHYARIVKPAGRG